MIQRRNCHAYQVMMLSSSTASFALSMCSSHQICHLTSMSLLSVASASFGCDNCVVFAIDLMTSQSLHWCTRSSQQESTTATICWPALRRRQLTRSNMSWTLPHWLSPRVVTCSMRKFDQWRKSDATIFIGRTSLTASNTDSASTSTEMLPTRHGTTVFVWSLHAGCRSSWTTTSSLCWPWKGSSILQGSRWQPSKDVRSPVPRHPHGTLCLQTHSKALSPFQKQSKTSSFLLLNASTSSALEVVRW